MQMTHDEVYGIYPNSYMQFRPALTRFPIIFNVSGDCVVGNGSGYDIDAVHGAMGEYIERYHFYNEVDINITAELDKLNPSIVVDKLVRLIEQIKKSDEPIDSYQFDLSETRNIFTNQKIYLPSVMISLAHSDSNDRNFIPFIDSCGQSVHVSREQAFSASLKEFIERQSLVGSWLSGKARFKILLEPHPDLGQSNKILSELQQNGVVCAYELNELLPGYSVLIFYFSLGTNDKVQYSVGMASDLTPASAISRALNELWQSYIFMYLNASNPESLDPRYEYLNHLISFNNLETQKVIPFFAQPSNEIKMDTFIHLSPFTEKECLRSLVDISPHIYSYERSNDLFGRQFHFCKITSPDFFLHMGLAKPLNFSNHYANLLSINPDNVIKSSIPFP